MPHFFSLLSNHLVLWFSLYLGNNCFFPSCQITQSLNFCFYYFKAFFPLLTLLFRLILAALRNSALFDLLPKLCFNGCHFFLFTVHYIRTDPYSSCVWICMCVSPVKPIYCCLHVHLFTAEQLGLYSFIWGLISEID